MHSDPSWLTVQTTEKYQSHICILTAKIPISKLLIFLFTADPEN